MSTHTAVLVTGASRGFGRALAMHMATKWTCKLTIILAASSSEGLQETATLLVHARAKAGVRNLEESMAVSVAAVDMRDLAAVEAWAPTAVEVLAAAKPSRVILVNNAGTVGDLGAIQELSDPSSLQRHMDVNVTSVMVLTAHFTRRFGAPRPDRDPVHEAAVEVQRPEAFVINISSLAALEPFQTWGNYCVTKAAREMFHRVLAQEQSHCKTFHVLNYAPGPMDTDMQAQIRNSVGTYGPLREAGMQAFDDGNLVTPLESSDLLLRLIDDHEFTSGSHFDYFDGLPDDDEDEDAEKKHPDIAEGS